MVNRILPVEISARHCHLSERELRLLFGKGYELKPLRPLSQPGQFAAEETVSIYANERTIKNVRVVGPIRSQTQVELSQSDALFLGLDPPLRLSGDLKGSAGIVITGPNGYIVGLNEGVIIAQRHIHCNPQQAADYKLEDGQIVAVKILGPRRVIFGNIIVRVSADYELALHIDTDEGNAAGLSGEGLTGQIINHA